MIQLIARYPVLTDGRLLGIVAAVALTLVSLIAGGDIAEARPVVITGGHR